MGSLAQVGLALATAVGAWINLLLVLGFAVRAGYLEFDARWCDRWRSLPLSGVVLAAALVAGRAIRRRRIWRNCRRCATRPRFWC